MVTVPTKIHWVRHAEVYNPQQILYGRLPRFGLSAKGFQQAQRTGQYFNALPITAVFSSPMLRARQTAKAMFGHSEHFKLRISILLNEVCTSFEGRPGAEIDARGGDVYTDAAACSEQPRDILERIHKFTARICRQYAGRQVVAVTHGDIITFMVLWAKGFDLTPENKNRLKPAGYPVSYPAHASITTLTYATRTPNELPQIQYRQP